MTYINWSKHEEVLEKEKKGEKWKYFINPEKINSEISTAFRNNSYQQCLKHLFIHSFILISSMPGIVLSFRHNNI